MRRDMNLLSRLPDDAVPVPRLSERGYAPGVVDLGLKGRTALVMGASSGLGLASAEALSAEGANVSMFARRRDLLEREADRIGALAVRGDVTLPEHLERAVSQTVKAFGGLDILVWNHGGPPPGPASAITAEQLEQAVDLMLAPAVRLVQLCLPQLERSEGGRIVGITSIAAKEPTDHLALSNMLRPGLTGYFKTLSRELGPQGITVNCVAPGRIATARLEQLYPEGPTPETVADIPLRRWGDPREFGDVVCFLASERARYVSGQTVVVDGGGQRFLF
jgi:3-oxoacyl-[acyl-carrier protein] reductase